MNIAQTILEYQTMQAVAESLAKTNSPLVQWSIGERLCARIYDFDISLDVESRPGYVVCSGETWAMGEDRPFEFLVPVVTMREHAEARLAVMA